MAAPTSNERRLKLVARYSTGFIYLVSRTGVTGEQDKVSDLIAVLRAALPEAIKLAEQDERFTTAEAERVLLEADLSRQKRKSVIDQQAAALILQGWLDLQRRSQ